MDTADPKSKVQNEEEYVIKETPGQGFSLSREARASMSEEQEHCSDFFEYDPQFPIQSNRDALFALHNALCSDALCLMKKKNVDYAAKDDPYENFRQFGRLGILVRLGDKFARLRNFERNGKFEVQDEGVRDTLLDILNYTVLYAGYK